MKKNIIKKECDSYSFSYCKYIDPIDKYSYKISSGVIKATEQVLLDYYNKKPSNEGFVYWAGKIEENIYHINTVIAPKTDSDTRRVTIPPIENFYYTKALATNNLVHIGQVHSHPEDWVGHSEGDNLWAAFKSDGLISIVVPNYGGDGMLPFKNCGFHRFQDQEFYRLSNKYVKRSFKIVDDKAIMIDLRNRKDE